jgi:hypothetical protein
MRLEQYPFSVIRGLPICVTHALQLAEMSNGLRPMSLGHGKQLGVLSLPPSSVGRFAALESDANAPSPPRHRGRTVRSRLSLAVLLAAGLLPLESPAADVAASRPTDLSVTVYRDPTHATAEGLDLDALLGFALITETRMVSVPAGESRVRFEGVADGIEPASAILRGLPARLLEKNHDARVLSPSALVAATLGRRVQLVRTDRKTGRTTRLTGTLRADNDGVVFESAQGIEALRCSGLPETFEFSSVQDLAATATLSVRVRSAHPLTTQVKLSYLARGFDWTASYVATVSPDARTMNLGAWVTLANGNGISFARAQAQIVAGRLNRESEPDEDEPLQGGDEILAQCWPTAPADTDVPPLPEPKPAPSPGALGAGQRLEEVTVTRSRITREQLGDLKLYRVPWRTTVASRQMKQVRLLDKYGIPVQLIYRADLTADDEEESELAGRILRTKNDAAHHLGLPLPSGLVDSFTIRDGAPLLLFEAPLRDIAVGEELEIDLGVAPDVEVSSVVEERTNDNSKVKELPLVPGVVHIRSAVVNEVSRIEIHTARPSALIFEAHLWLPDGTELIRAAPAPILCNGHPVFRLPIAAGGTAIIRYQTAHTERRLVR